MTSVDFGRTRVLCVSASCEGGSPVDISTSKEARQMEVVIERAAGLDVHKEIVMAAVRVPGGRVGRTEEIREF